MVVGNDVVEEDVVVVAFVLVEIVVVAVVDVEVVVVVVDGDDVAM